MREDAFRAYLAPRLGGPRSVGSYLSNARFVERRLGVDLDEADLTDNGIAAIRTRLTDAAVPPKRTGDCVSALRRYAELSWPA